MLPPARQRRRAQLRAQLGLAQIELRAEQRSKRVANRLSGGAVGQRLQQLGHTNPHKSRLWPFPIARVQVTDGLIGECNHLALRQAALGVAPTGRLGLVWPAARVHCLGWLHSSVPKIERGVIRGRELRNRATREHSGNQVTARARACWACSSTTHVGDRAKC